MTLEQLNLGNSYNNRLEYLYNELDNVKETKFIQFHRNEVICVFVNDSILLDVCKKIIINDINKQIESIKNTFEKL